MPDKNLTRTDRFFKSKDDLQLQMKNEMKEILENTDYSSQESLKETQEKLKKLIEKINFQVEWLTKAYPDQARLYR